MDEYERLIAEYNCAVANGLIVRARQLDRVIQVMEKYND
jgi:hypothetical protein